MKLIIEALPPWEWGPNVRLPQDRRVAYAIRHKAARDFLLEAMSQVPIPEHPWAKARATVSFVVPDRRRRDTDNYLACLKFLWDWLKARGVIIDDSWECLEIQLASPPVRLEQGRRATIIELEEIG